MAFTGNRLKAIEMLAVPDTWRSYEGIAQTLKIADSTLWRWRQEPEFQAEVIKRSQEWMGDEFAVIVAAHIKECKAGNMVAIKEYYERVLGKVTTPIEFEGSVSLVEVAAVLKGNYEERE